MQAADAHRLVGEAQRGVGGAEPLARIARPLAPEVHKSVEGDADLRQVRAEQVPHEAGVEVVAAGGDGRVRGEDDARAGDQPGLFERHLARGAQLADALERAQEAMSFVEVENTGIESQGPEHPHAADAEHDLLAQAAVGLRHVQAVGDAPQVLRVGLEVGVEEDQRDTPDLRPPHRDAHVALTDRRFDLDPLDLVDGQVRAAVLGVHLELASTLVDVLPAEALLVKEADRHERQAEVARRLQVVARQHAEAARVDGQALREAELEREVGDAERRLRIHEPRVALVVIAVRGLRLLEGSLDLWSFQGAAHSFLTQLGEEQDRVFARRLPELGVEAAEESLDAGLPGPEQVVCELLEFFEHANKIVVRKGR